MAVNNNAVSFSVSLNCNLTNPTIGGNAARTTGFSDGDKAADSLVQVASDPVVLNEDLGGDGLLLINNLGPEKIAISNASGLIGNIPAGTPNQPAGVLIPLADGVVISATCVGQQSVGVSVIKTTDND